MLPIDRSAADRSFCSGKHKKHGMNVQILADPFGRLLWASPALPGVVHEVRTAREHGIIGALSDIDVKCWADKEYRGAGGTVRVPCRGRWEALFAGQQAVNRKLRCSTTRITSLVQAVLCLHLVGSARRWKTLTPRTQELGACCVRQVRHGRFLALHAVGTGRQSPVLIR
jgi:hypothetical protein